MKDTYFVVGISTEVGKTIVSAILTEAFQADYWKPIQSGDLENSDTDKVKRLISNTRTVFHPNSYGLHTPASPHLSAQLDGVRIELSKIVRPETHPTDKVILVSRHYLGSINHTLLTYETLKNRGLNIHSIVFSGSPTPSTEEVILHHTNLPVLLHIDEEPYFDKRVISEYATKVNNP